MEPTPDLLLERRISGGINMADSAASFPYEQYNRDVWDMHDPEALAKYVASDARVHSMTPGKLAGSGLDYLKARATSLLNAFPDVKFVVEEIVRQGDLLAARVTLEGTHRADFAGIPASGKRMKVYDFAMYRVANDKITDIWSLIDMQAMRDQLQGGSTASGHFR
jgi:steroid delta-isomerase-like uncharacterized protein